MKYKIGDTIVLRDDLNANEWAYYNEDGTWEVCTEEMEKYKGGTYMIIGINDDFGNGYLLSNEDGCLYTDEMIERKIN